MPKVSEAHVQARRDQILDGARRTFARHGYEGATVARLEEEIGLSRGAIFNYFADKWSLFIALAAEDQVAFMRTLEEGGLDALIKTVASENPEWLAVYFELARRMRTNPELMEDLQNRAPEASERGDRFLSELQEAGVLRSDVDLKAITTFISVVANGLALARSLGAELDVDAMLTLLHSGIDPK